MKPQELQAFANSYANNIAYLQREEVMKFMHRYLAEHDSKLYEEYGADYTSIADALGVWHDAIKWHLEQLKEGVEA
jgi:hypothetical protein